MAVNGRRTRQFKRLAAAALALAAGAIVAELVTGFFTGVGLDLRQVGAAMGDRLKPSLIETSSIRPPDRRPSDKADCERQKKSGLEGADAALSRADAEFEQCMAKARQSWVKRWSPEKYCEQAGRLKRAVEAGREAWRAWKC